ncbi:MAG: hypothetical protein HQ572_04720, partial [Candidatus Omnitrophica bacterium]|nr:hypothetical protein [Candidatus Omnitrophota bacterium]
MNKTKYIRKSISVILLVTFIVTNSNALYAFGNGTLFKKTSHAQRHLAEEEKESLIDLADTPEAISIPQNLGRVLEYHKGKSDKLVIHIQDRHIDPVAQFNIATIVNELNTKYNTYLMCLEGASEELDTSFYDKFEDNPTKTKVAKFFVEKGLFTGAEFYKITNKENYIRATGAEDKKLYLKHLDCYRKNQPEKDSIFKFINGLSLNIDTLKQKTYSKALKEIDKAISSYKAKRTEFPEYLETLQKYSKKAKLDIRKYQALDKFLILIGKEKKVDFKKAEKQRESLIKHLSEKLGEADTRELVKMSLDFRANKISDLEFYNYIETIITDYQLPVTSYQNLITYIDYIKFSKTINHLKVFEEAEELEDETQKALCRNPIQEKVVVYSKAISMLKDLYSLKLTPRHLDYMENNPASFNMAQIQRFLKDTLNKYGLNAANLYYKIDQETLSLSKEFYQIALERDIALVNNTLKHMKSLRKDKAILVTGGFHTQGITNILKEKGVSYVVVCPNIGEGNYDKIYNERIAGRLPDIETLKAAFDSALTHPLPTGDLAPRASSSGTEKRFAVLRGRALDPETMRRQSLLAGIDEPNGKLSQARVIIDQEDLDGMERARKLLQEAIAEYDNVHPAFSDAAKINKKHAQASLRKIDEIIRKAQDKIASSEDEYTREDILPLLRELLKTDSLTRINEINDILLELIRHYVDVPQLELEDNPALSMAEVIALFGPALRRISVSADRGIERLEKGRAPACILKGPLNLSQLRILLNRGREFRFQVIRYEKNSILIAVEAGSGCYSRDVLDASFLDDRTAVSCQRLPNIGNGIGHSHLRGEDKDTEPSIFDDKIPD